MTPNVGGMVDISLLVTKITFVVAEIFYKEAVITSSAAKITFVVTYILFLFFDICLQILAKMIGKNNFIFLLTRTRHIKSRHNKG